MSPPSPSFLLFELKLINFCRILAIGLGYKKSLKYLKVIWLGKNGFETWRQSVIILCLKAFLRELISSLQSKTHRCWASGRGCFPLEHQPAGHPCKHSTCSTLEALQPPERPWSSLPWSLTWAAPAGSAGRSHGPGRHGSLWAKHCKCG